LELKQPASLQCLTLCPCFSLQLKQICTNMLCFIRYPDW